jgi:hypothetical protein
MHDIKLKEVSNENYFAIKKTLQEIIKQSGMCAHVSCSRCIFSLQCDEDIHMINKGYCKFLPCNFCRLQGPNPNRCHGNINRFWQYNRLVIAKKIYRKFYNSNTYVRSYTKGIVPYVYKPKNKDIVFTFDYEFPLYTYVDAVGDAANYRSLRRAIVEIIE